MCKFLLDPIAVNEKVAVLLFDTCNFHLLLWGATETHQCQAATSLDRAIVDSWSMYFEIQCIPARLDATQSHNMQ